MTTTVYVGNLDINVNGEAIIRCFDFFFVDIYSV